MALLIPRIHRVVSPEDRFYIIYLELMFSSPAPTITVSTAVTVLTNWTIGPFWTIGAFWTNGPF